MPTDYSKIRKFNSCEEMQEVIDAYFKDCEEKNRPLTMSGLGLALDMSRVTLMHYAEGDLVSLPEEERVCIVNTIAKAKWICENFVEEYLFTGKNTMAAVFNLKNNYREWKDKTEFGVDESVGSLKIEISNPNIQKDEGSQV